MLRSFQIVIVTTSLFFSSFVMYGFEIDSTEDSSIDFVSIEATLSSKIIHFQWSVDAEKSGDYFIIEKSIDQKNWKKVSRVESIENHKNRHTYAISEINLAEAKNEYFRISRVDAFGNNEVLDIINVNQPILSNLSLIPIQGKVENQIQLSYDSMICSHGEVMVINQDGETKYKNSIYSENGYNRYLLDIKSLNAGRYLIVIKDEYGNKTTRALNVYDNSRKGRKSKF